MLIFYYVIWENVNCTSQFVNLPYLFKQYFFKVEFSYCIFVLEPCHHKGGLFYVNDNTIFEATQLYSKKKKKSFDKLHQISIQGEWSKVSYYTRRHHLYYYTNWKSQPFNWLHDCSFPIKLRNNAYWKVDEALYSTCTYHQI